MRIFPAAALAVATLLASQAQAQAPMPEKDSAEAEMSGPGGTAALARPGGVVGADPAAILDFAGLHGDRWRHPRQPRGHVRAQADGAGRVRGPCRLLSRPAARITLACPVLRP